MSWEIEKCPECGNKNIIECVTREEIKEYSKSGKCIKVHRGGLAIMWNYKCKCGWISEVYTE